MHLKLNLTIPLCVWVVLVLIGTPISAGDKPSEEFQFGSYGRVVASSDTQGHEGKRVSVVSHRPRLLEKSYSELDFSYQHHNPTRDAAFGTHLTLGLGDNLFHYNGEFQSDIAIRNLYVEVDGALFDGLSLWAGSRMYRGDDVYLLDFWPLDDLNTVGGGFGYRKGNFALRGHLGLSRLNNDYQLQHVLVPHPQFGAREVVFLERQRAVGSVRSEYHHSIAKGYALKMVAYGELHSLPKGRFLEEDRDELLLPADNGAVVGAQIGLYEQDGARFVNVFARWGTGLGAYDELGIPLGLNSDKTIEGAQEIVLAMSSNWENSHFGMVTGLAARYTEDADESTYDDNDRWEVSAAIRPMVFVTEHFHVAAEANVQYLRSHGLSRETQKHEVPLVLQAALIPILSLEKGSYARPQIRLILALSHLNEAARLTYAAEDGARNLEYQSYIGIGAEWWFNSSRY